MANESRGAEIRAAVSGGLLGIVLIEGVFAGGRRLPGL
jgi:hypothetical protein